MFSTIAGCSVVVLASCIFMAIFSQFKSCDGSPIKRSPSTIHIGGKPRSISFSGCGFLGVYHIGVASCLKQHAPKLVKNFERIYGCSAGSIIGAMMLTDVCFGEVCYRTMKIVSDARSRYLGPLSPGFKLNEALIRDLRVGLPENAHELATGKLFISLTRVCDGKNVIVSEYASREELIQVLICSCFVPFYSGLIPPKYRGVRYVDGGLSNNLPADDDTITVSPWSGDSDICPRNDGSVSLLDMSFVNTSIQLTASNLYRCTTMLFPQPAEQLKDFCSQAFRETVQYLCAHGLFETEHPHRRNLSFSAQLNKLTERRNMTRRISATAQRSRKQPDLRNIQEEMSDEDCDDSSSVTSHNSSVTSHSSSVTSSDAVELTTDSDVGLKMKAFEECFDENDNEWDSEAPAKPEGAKVFTVIHSYPLDSDHVLKLEFHLPPPVLQALEAAFEQNSFISRLPLIKLLWSARQSIIVRIPLENAYSLACFVLSHASKIPSDLRWLARHLRHLVMTLHEFLKASGEALLLKIRSASGCTMMRLQTLSQQLAITLQLLLKALAGCSGVSSHSWLRPMMGYLGSVDKLATISNVAGMLTSA